MTRDGPLIRLERITKEYPMGAETVRGLVRRLVPEAEFMSRPRFSTLRYSGQTKISRLPPRSSASVVTYTEEENGMGARARPTLALEGADRRAGASIE